MDLEKYNKEIESLEISAFNVIRRKVSSFTDKSSNDEIAGFVKGVIELGRGIYEKLEREY